MSYIGANAQGLISNIDGGTISNATLNSSVTFPAGGTGNPISVAIIAEQFAYNVDSGASAGINLREINTEISDNDGIVTISGSPDYTFTITNTGLYLIELVKVLGSSINTGLLFESTPIPYVYDEVSIELGR